MQAYKEDIFGRRNSVSLPSPAIIDGSSITRHIFINWAIETMKMTIENTRIPKYIYHRWCVFVILFYNTCRGAKSKVNK